MMMRRIGRGDYQIGIWAIVRQGKTWIAEAVTEGGWRSELQFKTLKDAYEALTGEPLRL